MRWRAALTPAWLTLTGHVQDCILGLQVGFDSTSSLGPVHLHRCLFVLLASAALLRNKRPPWGGGGLNVPLGFLLLRGRRTVY